MLRYWVNMVKLVISSLWLHLYHYIMISVISLGCFYSILLTSSSEGTLQIIKIMEWYIWGKWNKICWLKVPDLTKTVLQKLKDRLKTFHRWIKWEEVFMSRQIVTFRRLCYWKAGEKVTLSLVWKLKGKVLMITIIMVIG